MADKSVEKPEGKSGRKRYVLDGTAVVSVLFREGGADQIEPVLAGSMISAVNYLEILVTLGDRGLEQGEAQTMLSLLDMDIVPFDNRQAEQAAKLWSASSPMYNLPLAACATIALAHTHDAIAVTVDPAWAGLKVPCEIQIKI